MITLDVANLNSESDLKKRIGEALGFQVRSIPGWKELEELIARNLKDPQEIVIEKLDLLEQDNGPLAQKMMDLFERINNRCSNAPCQIRLSRDYRTPVQFLQFSVEKYDDPTTRAFVNCWVKTNEPASAVQRATRELKASGWNVENVIETQEITKTHKRAQGKNKSYYEQCLIDSFVCVFYSWVEEG